MNADSFKWGEAPNLDAFESVMWRLDSFPSMCSNVASIEILDCVPDRARVKRAHETAVKLVPRLREKLVEPLFGFGLPEWCEDKQFSLDNQLSFVTLDAPGDMRSLLDIARDFAQAPFDGNSPLWGAMMVDGLEGGRAAYVLKMHHAITDGMGYLQLISHMHSRQREPGGGPVAPSEMTGKSANAGRTRVTVRQARRALKSAPDTLRQNSEKLRNFLKDLPDGESRLSKLASYALSMRRVMNPDKPEPSPLLADRSGSWHFEAMQIPLAEFKAAAKACNASLNDALISALLGGFRRYHQAFGEIPNEMPICFPINVRREGDLAGGNRFAAGELGAPLAEKDPAVRMRIIKERVSLIRKESALEVTLALMPLLARIPRRVLAKAMAEKLRSNDFQVSNIPGLRDDVYLAGARVTEHYPFGPLPGVPAMIALFSHGDTCCVGINIDRASITDPDLFMRCMSESFDEVMALA